MKKYEAVIILNPNLSSKVDSFIKDFEKLLKANTFKIKKTEDIRKKLETINKKQENIRKTLEILGHF